MGIDSVETLPQDKRTATGPPSGPPGAGRLEGPGSPPHSNWVPPVTGRQGLPAGGPPAQGRSAVTGRMPQFPAGQAVQSPNAARVPGGSNGIIGGRPVTPPLGGQAGTAHRGTVVGAPPGSTGRPPMGPTTGTATPTGRGRSAGTDTRSPSPLAERRRHRRRSATDGPCGAQLRWLGWDGGSRYDLRWWYDAWRHRRRCTQRGSPWREQRNRHPSRIRAELLNEHGQQERSATPPCPRRGDPTAGQQPHRTTGRRLTRIPERRERTACAPPPALNTGATVPWHRRYSACYWWASREHPPMPSQPASSSGSSTR